MREVNTNHKRPSRKFFYKMIRVWAKDHIRPMLKVENADPLFINPDRIRIWKVGHATLLIDLYGTMILTDPVLVKWIPFPRRLVECPYSAEDFPPLDYIIISHAHFDHFNRPSLKKLAHKTKTLIIPKNCSDLVSGLGFKEVLELEWDTAYENNGTRFHAIRPEHWGQRVPWEKVVRYYNAYVIEREGKSVYFGGDSGYGPFFKDVGEKHDISVALLGIGAYCPDQFLRMHKNPEQAVQALVDMNADHMIPMHYGDIRLSLEDPEEPVLRLEEAASRAGVLERIHVVPNGKNWYTDN